MTIGEVDEQIDLRLSQQTIALPYAAEITDLLRGSHLPDSGTIDTELMFTYQPLKGHAGEPDLVKIAMNVFGGATTKGYLSSSADHGWHYLVAIDPDMGLLAEIYGRKDPDDVLHPVGIADYGQVLSLGDVMRMGEDSPPHDVGIFLPKHYSLVYTNHPNDVKRGPSILLKIDITDTIIAKYHNNLQRSFRGLDLLESWEREQGFKRGELVEKKQKAHL